MFKLYIHKTKLNRFLNSTLCILLKPMGQICWSVEVHVIWLRESVRHYSNSYFLLFLFYGPYLFDSYNTLQHTCMSNSLLRLINAFLSCRLHTFTLLGKNPFTWFWIPLWAELLLIICLVYIGKAISS